MALDVFRPLRLHALESRENIIKTLRKTGGNWDGQLSFLPYKMSRGNCASFPVKLTKEADVKL